MARIALLPEEVASQVAAGEVVERPASVVKELVENSIDAGATRIEVRIRRGGISTIRVIDNGSGMDRDDALLCLERHATSKIRTGHDLAAIHTLGFRGEALPSIASVSRFRLTTREASALAGTEVIVNGGKIENVRDSGEAPGTQIEARQLFYNLPARRKFLRTENTESSHVEHQLHLQAIGHPQVGFVFVNDERVVYQLPPAAHLRDRIRDLCGAALTAELIEVPEFDGDGVVIRGFIGKAGVSRSSRAQQLVFLNGRAVENSTLSFALREGYHTALMRGQHPVTFLFIEMDPAAVDVNVHPAKREVRFRDPAHLREALVEATRRALESDRASWTQTFRPAGAQITHPRPPLERSDHLWRSPVTPPQAMTSPPAAVGGMEGAAEPLLPTFRQPGDQKQTPRSQIQPAGERGQSDRDRDQASEDRKQADESQEQRRESRFCAQNPLSGHLEGGDTGAQAGFAAAEAGRPRETVPLPTPAPETPTVAATSRPFKILGVLGKLYILLESAEGLVLVDQHAAHERILFEEMRRRMEAQGVPSQRLLLPLTLEVTPRDADWITRHLEVLDRAGIGLEPFGVGTFKIDSLPTFLRSSEPAQLLREIIDELRETSAQTSKLRLGEEMIAKTVCRHAVKANDFLREPELVRLIQDLLACDLPYCCPHGRPTMIQMSYSELEKKFGRKV